MRPSTLHGRATSGRVGCQDAMRPIELLGRGRHRAMDDAHLARMDAELAAEPEPQGATGVVVQTRCIVDLDRHAIDRGARRWRRVAVATAKRSGASSLSQFIALQSRRRP
jgi:hypothetical protein